MIFFTADHHFGHENIIKHCKRPFKDADEMDQYMVDQWNSVVKKGDTVYHLGDISHKRADPERVMNIIEELSGDIDLLMGNHEVDSDPTKDSRDTIYARMRIATSLFHAVHEGYFYLRLDGQLITMSHYAQETWHDMSKGTWHLHGHSHGKLNKKLRRLDVGVDTHDFRPWSLDEIKDHFGGRKPMSTETAF